MAKVLARTAVAQSLLIYTSGTSVPAHLSPWPWRQNGGRRLRGPHLPPCPSPVPREHKSPGFGPVPVPAPLSSRPVPVFSFAGWQHGACGCLCAPTRGRTGRSVSGAPVAGGWGALPALASGRDPVARAACAIVSPGHRWPRCVTAHTLPDPSKMLQEGGHSSTFPPSPVRFAFFLTRDSNRLCFRWSLSLKPHR